MPTYTHLTDPATIDPRIVASDLRRVLARAEVKITAIPPALASKRLNPGKWTPQEIVGHLIDSCMNNHQRLIRLQLEAELTFPAYQQVEWVALQRYDLRPWADLCTLLLVINRHFAHGIEHADRACLTHQWILDGQRITLGFILVDYIEHLEHHLRQLPG